MNHEHIIVETQEGIVTINFNRPKSLNALNRALMAELSEALDQIVEDEDNRVLVLTGTGEKSFIAGADITELTKLDSLQAKTFSETGHAVIGKLQQMDIPVIAAVNGFALGGGCEMALGCDIVYASTQARFGLPEINLGLIPGFGGTQRLPRLIGKNGAKELIFTGRMISADEAKALGLVNRVFEAEELLEETYGTARTIAAKGRVSLRAAKQAINSGFDTDLQTGCRIEIDAFALCMASEDAKEGTRAFLEKREAQFKGKLK